MVPTPPGCSGKSAAAMMMTTVTVSVAASASEGFADEETADEACRRSCTVTRVAVVCWPAVVDAVIIVRRARIVCGLPGKEDAR